MEPFNWRVASPNTWKTYAVAIKDFETITGVRVDRADAALIERYRASMQVRGLKQNTIRSRMSAVSIVSGVKITLPKKIEAEPVVMSEEQVKAFFRKIEKDVDRELLVSIVLTGRQPIKAHWITTGVRALSTQEITRKIKRYARLAGLNETQVNMRTLIRTGKFLISQHDMQYLLEHLLPKPAQPNVEWKALHGIGRRPRRQMAVSR